MPPHAHRPLSLPPLPSAPSPASWPSQCPHREAPPPVAACRGAGPSSPRGSLPTQPALRSSGRWLSSSSLGRPGSTSTLPVSAASCWESAAALLAFPCHDSRPGSDLRPRCSPRSFSPGLLLRTRLRPLHPASRPPPPSVSQSPDRHVAASGRTPCALQGPQFPLVIEQQSCFSASAPFPMRPPLACPVSPGLSPGVSPGAAPLPPCHLTPPPDPAT